GSVVGPLVQVEIQRREPVLAVDDQELRAGLVDRAHAAVAVRAEGQPLRGEQQHRSRNRRLRHRGLVEVLELAHLSARDGALERGVGALDAGDELGDVVVLRDSPGLDLLALAVEAADEAQLRQEVLGAVADEIKDAVLLSDLRRLHGTPSVPLPGRNACFRANIPETYAQNGSIRTCKTSAVRRF